MQKHTADTDEDGYEAFSSINEINPEAQIGSLIGRRASKLTPVKPYSAKPSSPGLQDIVSESVSSLHYRSSAVKSNKRNTLPLPYKEASTVSHGSKTASSSSLLLGGHSLNNTLDGDLNCKHDCSDCSPPPIPPKKQSKVSSDTTTGSLEVHGAEPEELTLSKLVTEHKDFFPLQVIISKGFYGNCERSSVSEDDIYNVHFAKKTKVVIVQDSNLVEYRICVSSPVQIGFLHNPENNFTKALEGYKYKTVGNLMSGSPLPKFVCATAEYKSDSPKTSLQKNELLAVRDVVAKKSQNFLSVYSVTTSELKLLPESCEGNFTTKPYNVRLPLSEVPNFLQLPFPPTLCLMYVHGSTREVVPSHLISSVLTLVGYTDDLSIIATPAMADSSVVAEIPVDLDIEVKILRSKSLGAIGRDELMIRTRKIMDSFDPTNVCLYGSVSEKRSILFSPRASSETKEQGYELILPPVLLNQKQPADDDPGSQKQHDQTTFRKDRVPQAVPRVQPHKAPTFIHLEAIVETLERSIEQLKQEVCGIKADLKHLDNDLNSFKEETSKTLRSLASTSTITHYKTPPFSETSKELPRLDHEEFLERNKKYLRTLDSYDIIKLLKAMGLAQYQTTFEEHGITGEVLAQCDESILKKELGIKSKLHRIKLMKLIGGQLSAESIFNKEDSYGFLQMSYVSSLTTS